MDPLGQISLCCGLGPRRRDYQPPVSQFYSPSSIHLDPANAWGLPNRFHHPPNQPYLILTQPLIIANPPGTNQTNTMTLVQQTQTAPSQQAFPALPFLTSPQRQVSMHPNMVTTNQYIYDSMTGGALIPALTRPESVYQPKHDTAIPSLAQNFQSLHKLGQHQQSNSQHPLLDQKAPSNLQPQKSQNQQPERRVISLSSEIFRQIETIERQVDLSRDMELVERHGVVITRALNPYSLMPHLSEATLRRYNTHFLLSEEYVIRFIEIIKRPGQTLGLYIRTVTFEDPNGSSREGLVITKVDSDSPIYDSQVLSVGDEILSINLVEIQGMSLDDVVILMSMPKRLVLALRIPKDRDQLLSMNLLQQQQVLKDSIEQQDAIMRSHTSRLNERPTVRSSMSNLNNMYDRYENYRPDALGTSAAPKLTPGTSSMPYNTLPALTKPPLLGSIRLGDTPEQSSYFSSSIDAINRELKELRRQRMALCDDEDEPAIDLIARQRKML